jgi:iron-sulfur cluster repair protein YtfE (RIC family)
MDATHARKLLLAQHDSIRSQLDLCRGIAQRVRRGEVAEAELDAGLDRLRDAFSTHNLSESSLIRPLLIGAARWGESLLERMIEEHLGEHVAMWQAMGRSSLVLATQLDDLADELDAHMAAEERTFLAVLDPEVLERHRA